MAPSTTWTRLSAMRSRTEGTLALVVQVGGEPALHRRDVYALAPVVFLDLVELDLADAEVLGLRVPEIPAADGRRWQHREALGQGDARVGFRPEQVEQRALLGVVGAGRVARRWPDALILLVDQGGVVERLVGGVAPVFAAHAL